MSTERDLRAKPYTADEKRVATVLADRANVGGGDDPIGFILASHAELARQRTALQALIKPLEAAVQALRSYQHGNGAPDLAREVADAAEAALAQAWAD